MSRTVIQAHRGASAYAPENTLPAFRLAREMGADGIECDIHLTKDGRFLVCHDETVDRTSTSQGRICDLTLPEIQAFDFGCKFAPEFGGVTAPTLEELLEVVSPMRVINIEIKEFTHEMGQTKGIEKLYGILKDFDVTEKIIVSSFDFKMLELLKTLYPHVYTCYLYIEMKNPARFAQSVGCSAIHPYFGRLKKQTVDSAHRRGMQVNCWTVDGEDDIRRMIRMGCDGIITDKPDIALKAAVQAEA